jgi:hypothetical protein
MVPGRLLHGQPDRSTGCTVEVIEGPDCFALTNQPYPALARSDLKGPLA